MADAISPQEVHLAMPDHDQPTDHAADRRHDDHPAGDPSDVGPIGDIDGATQAAPSSSGAAGGTGATAALGGAGAGGPIGATPDPSREAVGAVAPDDAVKTEYEMGHEFDPAHERLAESGYLAEQAGTAESDRPLGSERREED